MAQTLDSSTQEIGRRIFALVRDHGHVPSPSQWIDERLMAFGMRDPRLKTQLFRFVDVLPTLGTSADVAEHIWQYLAADGQQVDGSGNRKSQIANRNSALPRHIAPLLGVALANPWLSAGTADLARLATRRLARRFIAADTLEAAAQRIADLRRRQLAFSIDVLGEAVLSESEAQQYQSRYLELIEYLAPRVVAMPAVELIDRDCDSPIRNTGTLPRLNVSVKLSSLFSQFDPIDPAGSSRAVAERLRPILRAARRHEAAVNIDMESFTVKDLTLRIFMDVLGESEFADWADIGIAIQAYLTSAEADLHALAEWAGKRPAPIWVRLVKGAYWDFETIIAAQNGWPSPVFMQKPATDASFERCTDFLIEHHRTLRPAVASHNIRSIAHALAAAEAANLPPRTVEFQLLYGMADPIKAALVKLGQRVRVYTPVGELLPGMAYLIRRLLENTSNESFLRAGFTEHVPEEVLLMNPLDVLKRSATPPSPCTQGEGRGEGLRLSASDSFTNEPLSDFSQEVPRRAMQQALDEVRKQFGRDYPLVISARRIETGRWIDAINPSHSPPPHAPTSPLSSIGRWAVASPDHARQAVAAAAAALPAWRDTSPGDRANLLRRAAAIMRRRRFELAAWEVYETAKQWREADADVAEAIDYCEYYAAEMLRLSRPQRRDVAGEDNEYFYEPRGVAVIIAPWNFPLAILAGMTAAALVTGNTAIIKPAKQSTIIGAKLMEVLEEAGLPPGVGAFLPGLGEEMGPALVSHPDVSVIGFTGSRAVGLSIFKLAAETPHPQDHVKHVITEMGGKNAIIVDSDADMDEAVKGIVSSAFGYAGQKCSACSRVIALQGVYDALLPRLVEATRSLRIGPAEDAGNFVGPVIDAKARDRILSFIEQGKRESRLAYAADIGDLAAEGYYVGPHIFADVPPSATIAREEIFGPVLSVVKAKDMTEAIRIANSTTYALTGGLYSRNPANIARVRREFRTGNLYINRKITGALVDRQPFGGFKLSGGGTKAGGPDYLLHFVLPRTITENTLRRGFAPEEA